MNANIGTTTTSTSIATIRNKLDRGEKLSVNDLWSLDPLHDAIYDHEGCCIVGGDSYHDGDSGGDGDGGHDGEPITGGLVDYLDRSLLDGRNQKGQQQGRLPRLVRYVGKWGCFCLLCELAVYSVYIHLLLRYIHTRTVHKLHYTTPIHIILYRIISYFHDFESKKRHGSGYARSRILRIVR